MPGHIIQTPIVLRKCVRFCLVDIGIHSLCVFGFSLNKSYNGHTLRLHLADFKTIYADIVIKIYH